MKLKIVIYSHLKSEHTKYDSYRDYVALYKYYIFCFKKREFTKIVCLKFNQNNILWDLYDTNTFNTRTFYKG